MRYIASAQISKSRLSKDLSSSPSHSQGSKLDPNTPVVKTPTITRLDHRFSRSVFISQGAVENSGIDIGQKAKLRSPINPDRFAKTTKDSAIQKLLSRLNEEGLLIEENDTLRIPDLNHWQEGLDVSEIIFSFSLCTQFDMLDILAKINWGPFKPMGQKNMNASFRSLGDVGRFAQETHYSSKQSCLTHNQGERDLMQLFLLFFYMDTPINKAEALAWLAEFSSYDLVARLLVEYDVLQRVGPSMGIINSRRFDLLLSDFERFFEISPDEFLTLNKDQYEQLRTTQFEKYWQDINVDEDKAASFLRSNLAKRLHDDIKPDKVLAYLRMLNTDTRLAMRLLPPAYAQVYEAVILLNYLDKIFSMFDELTYRSSHWTQSQISQNYWDLLVNPMYRVVKTLQDSDLAKAVIEELYLEGQEIDIEVFKKQIDWAKTEFGYENGISDNRKQQIDALTEIVSIWENIFDPSWDDDLRDFS